MARHRLLAVLVLAGAGLMPVAPARAALETLVQDDASLLHRPIEQVRASMQKLRSLGVDRVRLTANWSVLTREADTERSPSTSTRATRPHTSRRAGSGSTRPCGSRRRSV